LLKRPSTVRIGGHETAQVGGVEAGAEVVVAGFGVAFFGGEFAIVVGLRLGGAFAAEGVVIGEIAGAARAVEEPDIAEGIKAVVVDPVTGLFAGDEPAK
jgi:hypothetical protein